MAELLAATAGLFGGIGVGFAGNRRPGAWFPIVVTVVAAACVATVVYASSTPGACPAGAECEPQTWVTWAWLGAGLLGLWLIPVGIGYAIGLRFRPV